MAKTIAYIHLICLLFLVFGFLLPLSVTYYHLVAVPVVIFHWWMNNNQCVLTQLQKKFEKKCRPEQNCHPEHSEGSREKLEGNFTRDLLLKFGINLTDKQILILIYSVMTFSWSISLAKVL